MTAWAVVWVLEGSRLFRGTEAPLQPAESQLITPLITGPYSSTILTPAARSEHVARSPTQHDEIRLECGTLISDAVHRPIISSQMRDRVDAPVANK